MKQLPFAVDDFAEFSQQNFFYADKTRILRKLLRRPRPYFLSRPRRFGKTLLVSALDRVLRGQRELFKGLWIYDSDYNWAPHPVIKLEMNALDSSSPESLKASLLTYMYRIAIDKKLDISLAVDPFQAFSMLIQLLYEKHNEGITDLALKKRVAILIDEYDAPIINNLENPDLAAKIRDTLALFYGVLKTRAEERGFVFITGVSRFTKASIFSALNNLKDLTLNPSYLNVCRTNPNICGQDPKVCEKNINQDCDINFSDICGFNLRELEELLSDSLDQTFHDLKANGSLPPDSSKDDVLKLILDWYDGYTWDGKTRVFNPWSIFSFLEDNIIDNYWYESGTPSFLPKMIKSGQITFDLTQELIFSDKNWNSIDEIDKLSSAVLLFQTGYLTVKEILTEPQARPSFRLGPPNLEIAAAFGPLLLSLKAPKKPLFAKKFSQQIFASLFKLDVEGFQDAFRGLLFQYPYDIHLEYEAYYHSLLLSAFFLADISSFKVEYHTGEGRLDATVMDPADNVFVIELKYLVVEEEQENSLVPPKKAAKPPKDLAQQMEVLAREALCQINKKYAPTFLVGPNRVFSVALVVAGRTTVLAQIEDAKKVG
jgi:hypothetical protein